MLKDTKFQKTVLVIAVPLMLQQLIVSSVNLIDNLMVGQLGDIALSAVSMANRFYMIVWAGVNGTIASSVIYLSQYRGASDENHMKQSFRFMLVSSYLLCIVLFVIAFFFPEKVIGFFINDINVIRTGASYLKIAAISYLPSVLSLSVASAFRALGETKKPLYISIVSVLTNAIFNYLLIFGVFGFPQLGVVGAAIATLIARIVEAFIYLILLKRSDMPFKTSVFHLFRFELELAKRITIRALPLCINEILWSFGMSTLVRSYSSRGLVVNTAYSMASTIADLFFVLFGGMANGSKMRITTPLLRSGGFADVLTKDEKKFLEYKLGLEPNALSVHNRINNFWDDANENDIGRVELIKGDNPLDLSNPIDYIKYKILLANKDQIAPSVQIMQDKPKATYKFVIINEGDSTKDANLKVTLKAKAYMEFGKINDNKEKMRVIIETLDGRPTAANSKLEFLQGKLGELIEANTKTFLQVAKDPLLDNKVLIKKAIEAGLIANRGNFLYLRDGNMPLCDNGQEPTLSVAANYLAMPKQQELKFSLEAKLKE